MEIRCTSSESNPDLVAKSVAVSSALFTLSSEESSVYETLVAFISKFLSVRRPDRYGAKNPPFTREGLVCTLHGGNVNDTEKPRRQQAGA
jgi:hypothetical protein